MRLPRCALRGAAAAALTVAGCGWADTAPSVRDVAATAPPLASREERTHFGMAGFGVQPSFDLRLVRASALRPRGGRAAPRVDPSRRPAAETVPPPISVPPTTVPGPSIATHDVMLDSLRPVAAIPPVAVRIPDEGVSNPVVPVGVDAETGELTVPPDAGQVGWYQFGSTPGDAGSAVLAGHVDWKGQPGAFIDLDRVAPGQRVEVDLGDGTTRAFVVVETHLIAKTELPRELFERTGPPKLVLITCGGEFDRSIRRYRQNVVVVATPA